MSPARNQFTIVHMATPHQLATRLAVLSAMARTNFILDKMLTGWRVQCQKGARDVSPRLTSNELLDWIEAGISVLENMGRGNE